MTQSKSRVSLGLKAAAASTAVANLVTGGLTAMAPQAQAQTAGGPSLTTSPSISVNTAATFNNSWGSSFSSNGSTNTGSASFTAPTAELNSGTAYVQGGASFLQGSAGVASAVSGISSNVMDAGSINALSIGSAGITLPTGGTAFSAGVINPSAIVVSGSGAAASYVGTNIGTEVLQVGGTLTNTVINELTAF